MFLFIAKGCKYSDGKGTATAGLIAAAGILDMSSLENLPEVRQGMAGFMNTSMAASTWGRYATGWRTFEAFHKGR
jgi:O-acetylhomoserine/O-acetylserine sulfhydrylase-like pyridoxal-dependent enzyme